MVVFCLGRGNSFDGSGATLTLTEGAYQVTEDDYSPAYTTQFSAGCSGTAEAGEEYFCTITNDDIAPILTVVKVLLPEDDPGLFNLQIDGTTAGTGANVSDGGTTGPVEVSAGSHTVGETGGTDTDLADYHIVVGGDCAADGTITLALAENKTCTITNSRLGSLTVTKVVDWNGVPPVESETFEICITGESYPTGTEEGDCQTVGFEGGPLSWENLIPDDYTVTETPANPEWWDVAIVSSPVTVPAGGSAEVEITNTYRVSSITVIKDAGSNTKKEFDFTFDDLLDQVDDEAFWLKGGQSQAFSPLPAGSYTISEIVPKNWALLSIVCTIGGEPVITLPSPDPTEVTIELGNDEHSRAEVPSDLCMR